MEITETSLVHYEIDARASRFTVQAFATGLLSAVGHNPTMAIRKFNGAVDFSPNAVAGSGLRLAIQAASLAVQDDISSGDRREIEKLMNDQVLESAKYPEILYDAPVISITRVGDSLYTAALNGNLSLHGATRNQQVSARISIFGEMIRASGDFMVKQSDFQIKPVSVAGGALKIKDEVKCSFELVARKQQ